MIQEIVGKLNYLTVTRPRPDVAFLVSVVSQLLSPPQTSY